MRIFYFIVLFIVFNPVRIQAEEMLDNWIEKDTIKISKDSLLKIIRAKDSLLLIASIDSLTITNLLERVWWDKDSIQKELQNLKYILKIDSTYRKQQDSLWVEYNRDSRWKIRDSLYLIEQDSVRTSLNRMIDMAFNDLSRNPYPGKYISSWENLVYHLANDSTYFRIHYGTNDSITVVLKDGSDIRNAIFLTNEQADSAKVYFRGLGKHDIQMWVDENLLLTQVLKKTANPESIMVPERSVANLKIPRRKMPPALKKYWTLDGKIDLTMSQLAFSNWASGADNRLSFLFNSKGSAKYKKGKMSWNSDYWYRLGLVKSEGVALHKNIDILKANSSFYHKAFNNFSYSATAQLLGTQLFKGYKSVGDTIPTSKLLSPAQVIMGLGMNYKPRKGLSVDFHPLSGKFIIVIDTVNIDPTKHGLAGDQRIKGHPGAKLNVNYKTFLLKTVNLNTRLTLFSDYSKELKKVDVDWTTQLSLKVNKYVSTKLYFYVKYDDDAIIPFFEWKDGVKTKIGEGKKVQLQESFGVTFTYFL